MHFKTGSHYKHKFRQKQWSSWPAAGKWATGQAQRVHGFALMMQPHRQPHRWQGRMGRLLIGTEGARWWKTVAQDQAHRSRFRGRSHPYTEECMAATWLEKFVQSILNPGCETQMHLRRKRSTQIKRKCNTFSILIEVKYVWGERILL